MNKKYIYVGMFILIALISVYLLSISRDVEVANDNEESINNSTSTTDIDIEEITDDLSIQKAPLDAQVERPKLNQKHLKLGSRK